jgi:hypothetical protein
MSLLPVGSGLGKEKNFRSEDAATEARRPVGAVDGEDVQGACGRTGDVSGTSTAPSASIGPALGTNDDLRRPLVGGPGGGWRSGAQNRPRTRLAYFTPRPSTERPPEPQADYPLARGPP